MMKSLFSFLFLTFLCYNANGQIYYNPQTLVNHFNNPYNLNISGNGTLYYTTDGSTPTLSSTSSVNSVDIFIDQNKTINVFLVDSQGNSSPIETHKYFTGTLPQAKLFFLPPSNWTSACSMAYMIEPNVKNGMIIDPIIPGSAMSATGCAGWYKYEGFMSEFYEGVVSFNNCPPFSQIPGSITTNSINVSDIIFYDFSNGEITNPPSCLLSTNEADKKIVLVKIQQNPVEEQLTFTTDLIFEEFKIIGLSGKLILQGKLKSNTIAVSSLESGSYFVELISKRDIKTIIKFIKK